MRLLATSGGASAPLPIRGTDGDLEPTWPQWISPSIKLDFVGWRKESIPVSSFVYRAPVTAAEGDKAADRSAADAFGIDMVDKGETALIAGMTWSSSSVKSIDPILIDDMRTGDIAAWKQHGTPEGLHDIILSVARAGGKVAGSALKLDFARTALARAAALRALHRQLEALGQTYATFVPASPFQRIIPASLPEPKEMAAPIDMFACADQIENASFCIYAQKGLHDVTIKTLGPLLGSGHRIDASAIDVRVVKVWSRQGTGKYRDPDAFGPNPELLVKDDREPLSAPTGSLPNVRLTGDPSTTVVAGSSKQFWVQVHVPHDARPGHYTTQLQIRAPGAAISSVSLGLDVLPLRLLNPAKQYAVEFAGKVGGPGGTPSAAPSITSTDPNPFTTELADIAQHGFRFASLTDAPPALWDAYTAYHQASLGTPIVYSGLNSQDPAGVALAIQKARAEHGIDSVAFMVTDESRLADELRELHTAKVTTAAYIRDSGMFDALQSNLDMPIYSVGVPYVQDLLKSSGVRKNDKHDWWYWPAAENDPQANRLYAGYLLWKSNLYGALVTGYQNTLGQDPYRDENPWTAAQSSAAGITTNAETALTPAGIPKAAPATTPGAQPAVPADATVATGKAATGPKSSDVASASPSAPSPTGSQPSGATTSAATPATSGSLATSMPAPIQSPAPAQAQTAAALAPVTRPMGGAIASQPAASTPLPALRPLLLAYPATGGVIDTVQWEATSAGINDVRYLTTYFAAMRECKDNHLVPDLVRTAQSKIASLLNRASWLQDPAMYQAVRHEVALNAVQLRTAVDKMPAAASPADGG